MLRQGKAHEQRDAEAKHLKEQRVRTALSYLTDDRKVSCNYRSRNLLLDQAWANSTLIVTRSISSWRGSMQLHIT